MNFHNLENRVIKTALALKATKLKQGEELPEWKGFHGFRRGIASNLLGMGIHPRLIAAILWHSDMTTTLELYTMIPDNETREALGRLQARLNADAPEMPDQK